MSVPASRSYEGTLSQWGFLQRTPPCVYFFSIKMVGEERQPQRKEPCSTPNVVRTQPSLFLVVIYEFITILRQLCSEPLPDTLFKKALQFIMVVSGKLAWLNFKATA